MENYEYDPQAQEPVVPVPEEPEINKEPVAPIPEEPEIDHVPAEKPVSPFADSPYVTAESPKYEWDCGIPVSEKPKKKSGKAGKRILAAVLIIVLVVTCCGITAGYTGSYWAGEMKAMKEAFEDKLEDLQEQIEDNSYTGNGNSISGTVGTGDGLTPGNIYAKTVDSVIAVTATVSSSGSGFGQSSVSKSSGSGFILTEDGYAVTNYHVVENATSVEITTNDQQTYKAKVIGFDAAHDVAVLKADAENLQPADLGSSDDLIIGDQVVVIGNPLGELTSTLTVGYISGKDRGISTENTYINMLQTDAAINSGNSGGPMFNMKGQVVGITTAKYSGSTASGASIEGIGFAIPIDDVIAKIRDLVEYGYVTGAYLGVSVRDMDSSVCEAFGLPMGAYVADVTDGYCAKAAGVQAKDVIIGLGDRDVRSVNELTAALQQFKASDTTTITVWRSGMELELTITLDEKPHD